MAMFLKQNCSVWFIGWSLTSQFLGSWPPEQCQVWISHHRMDPKYKHILVGDSHELCATNALAHPPGRLSMCIKNLVAVLVLAFPLCYCEENTETANNTQHRKTTSSASSY